MRSRNTAIATLGSLVLLLTACGGSNDSSTAQRTKNAALPTAVVPQTRSTPAPPIQYQGTIPPTVFQYPVPTTCTQVTAAPSPTLAPLTSPTTRSLSPTLLTTPPRADGTRCLPGDTTYIDTKTSVIYCIPRQIYASQKFQANPCTSTQTQLLWYRGPGDIVNGAPGCVDNSMLKSLVAPK